MSLETSIELIEEQQAGRTKTPGPDGESGERSGAESSRSEDGLRKAAIFLITLEEEAAAEVFKHLSDEEARILSQEIARLGVVETGQVAAVLGEFQRILGNVAMPPPSGSDQAIHLLRKSFPPETADRIIHLIGDEESAPPFGFLRETEVESIFPYLQEEHPQTIALVLSYMDSKMAAAFLGRLSPERQADIVERIATIDLTSPEAIKQVEVGLKRYLSSMPSEEFQEVGGIKTCADILKVLDRDAGKAILEKLEGETPELSDGIKELMFVFEDILAVDDRGIQAFLERIASNQLAMALKGSTPELQEKFFKNMSQRAAEAVKEEMEYLGPVRLSEVKAAQQGIIEIIQRLEACGEIVISGRDSGEDVIV